MKKTQILVVSLVALIVISICSIFLYSFYTNKNSMDTSVKETVEINENLEDAEYDEISFNIDLGGESYFWATNTDAKTLKDLIKEHEGDEFFKTSEKNGEFKIESYRNAAPEKGQEWIFILENCEETNEFCIVENFEDLELTKNLNFFVIMGEKDKVEL